MKTIKCFILYTFRAHAKPILRVHHHVLAKVVQKKTTKQKSTCFSDHHHHHIHILYTCWLVGIIPTVLQLKLLLYDSLQHVVVKVILFGGGGGWLSLPARFHFPCSFICAFSASYIRLQCNATRLLLCCEIHLSSSSPTSA